MQSFVTWPLGYACRLYPLALPAYKQPCHAMPCTGSLVLAVRWLRPVLITTTTTRIQWRQIVL